MLRGILAYLFSVDECMCLRTATRRALLWLDWRNVPYLDEPDEPFPFWAHVRAPSWRENDGLGAVVVS